MKTDRISNLGYLAGATRFRRISEKLHADGDKIYRDHQIEFKASWFSCFYILGSAGEPRTVVELADEIGYTHITVKNVVRELAAAGLVIVKGHPSDKRSKHITLSAKGTRLFGKLEPIWNSFSLSLKYLLETGHPDFLNSLRRIEEEIVKHPIHETVKKVESLHPVQVLDYKPSLKKSFFELAGNWLLEILGGQLEEEDQFTLNNPDKAYLLNGGFVFFAVRNKEVVGCVALKRLNEDTFEFAKLFINKKARSLGVATRLIERCITRCRENQAKQLWLQTTMRMPEAHRLYYKLGFQDRKAPAQMQVLKRTEKVMVMDL